jgi:hypothetical protein
MWNTIEVVITAVSGDLFAMFLGRLVPYRDQVRSKRLSQRVRFGYAPDAFFSSLGFALDFRFFGGSSGSSIWTRFRFFCSRVRSSNTAETWENTYQLLAELLVVIFIRRCRRTFSWRMFSSG